MRKTKQQELIYNIVMSDCTHPSAEAVFQQARLTMPKISLGTVYRVLKNLAESGKIARIHLEPEDRFDKTITTHAHFKCVKCGSVTDVPVIITDEMIKAFSSESGNEVTTCNAVFTGICTACKSNNTK